MPLVPYISRDPTSKVVATFQVPFKGTWRNMASHLIPGDALADSNNVYIWQGKLRNRPGMLDKTTPYTASVNPIIGGGMALNNNTPVIVALSRTECREAGIEAAFTTTSTGTYAASNLEVLDIEFSYIGTTLRGYVANRAQPLRLWTPGSGLSTITPTVGTVPSNVRSLCIAGQRIVCLIASNNGTYPQDTLVWSGINSYTNWPSLAYIPVNTTMDPGTCLATLGNLGFAIYKQKSIYVARSQPGTDASCFVLSEPFFAEGPAGPKALVNVNGKHIYITRTGRIGVFDGINYPEWIADGIWHYLNGSAAGSMSISSVIAARTFALYNPYYHAVFFFYPRVDTGNALGGIVIVSLPLEGGAAAGSLPGSQQPAAFLGQTGNRVSHGLQVYSTTTGLFPERSMLFDDTLRPVYLDETQDTDLEFNIDAMFKTGLAPLPELQTYEVAVEMFLERASTNGQCNVSLVTSSMLETNTGVVQPAQILSLVSGATGSEAIAREYSAWQVPTRFAGIQCTLTPAAPGGTGKLIYGGANIYGRPILDM